MGIFGAKEQKTDKFIVHLIAQTEKTHEALIYLEATLENDDFQTKLIHLKKILRDIDEIRRLLIDDLLNTFITPIDREDIYNISNALYDMVDYSYTTTDEMHILHIKPDEYIKKMIGYVKRQTEELDLAIKRISKNPRVSHEHVLKVKKLEKDVEKQYRRALKDLFLEVPTLENLPQLFYKREVYRHISNMADRADATANVFGIVIMKLT